MNGPITVEAMISKMPPAAAKMLAVEILLANPESLHDDVLERFRAAAARYTAFRA